MSDIEAVALDYEPVGVRQIIAGDPGVGIASATVDGSGDLTLTMTDGTTRGPWHVAGGAGPANTLTASAVTGAPGSEAAATITGESPSQHLEITVPSGLPGTAATVAVDPTSGGVPYGTPTSVTNTGTPSAAVIKVSVQEGKPGDPGDPGTPGKNLEFAWQADTLGVRQQGDTVYTYSQSLTGPAGSASTYEYWGQGRPDVAGTLDAGGTAWVSAATQGAVFHSTTGDQGAQVWTKTAAGWVVTDGDTGWRTVMVSTTPGWQGVQVFVRRTADTVHLKLVSTGTAAVTNVYTLPPGFRSTGIPGGGSDAWSGPRPGAGGSASFSIASFSVIGYDGGTAFATAHPVYPTTDPWPTALPGTPA